MKIGDVVHLKGCHLWMTVGSIKDDCVGCLWLGSDLKPIVDTFSRELLVKVDTPDPQPEDCIDKPPTGLHDLPENVDSLTIEDYREVWSLAREMFLRWESPDNYDVVNRAFQFRIEWKRHVRSRVRGDS